MKYRNDTNDTPYHEEVRFALQTHFSKWGFTAFKDECYLVRYAGEGLSIEWGSATPVPIPEMEWGCEGIAPVHIPEYENILADWISGYENPSPSGEELYQMELEMNLEHIGVMVQKARNAERDYECDY